MKEVDAKTLFHYSYERINEILREFDPRVLLIDNLSPIKGFLKEILSIFKDKKDKHHDLEIHMANSNAWSALQFVDLLAWSCFRAYENGDSFYLDRLN